jgi:hypothetical protein
MVCDQMYSGGQFLLRQYKSYDTLGGISLLYSAAIVRTKHYLHPSVVVCNLSVFSIMH